MSAVAAYPNPLGALTSGQKSLALTLPGVTPANCKYPIVVPHGHGGDCTQMEQGGSFGAHPLALARAGHYVLGMDMSGGAGWGGPHDLPTFDEVYAALGRSKIGVLAWSMGHHAAMQWAKRNASKVRAIWGNNPMTDIDWAHHSASYAPSYTSFWGADSYQPEIEGAWDASVALACVSAVSPGATGALAVTMPIPSTVPTSGTLTSQVTAMTITYTGWNNTFGNGQFTGCTASSSGTGTAAGAVWFTSGPSVYTQLVGYRTFVDSGGLAAYRGLGFPWKLAQASDDATLPPAAAAAFAGGVSDPNLTVRTPSHTGGHTSFNYPTSEVVAFFDAA